MSSRNRKRECNALGAALTALIGVAAATTSAMADGAVDATLQSGRSSVASWSDPANWADGIPPSGAGATLSVRGESDTGYSCWALFNQDVTLGHILRPADSVQPTTLSANEYKDCLQILWDQAFRDGSETYAPIDTWANKSFKPNCSILTMDSGVEGQPATIQHLVPSASMSGKRFQMYIEPPLCLMSDLYIRYLGPSDGSYGTGYRSSSLCSHVDGAVYLSGGISEGTPGRGVTIDNPVYTVDSQAFFTPVFLGGISTFTGSLKIEAGMARLWGEDRFEGDSHALGLNNHIYATSGDAVLDLAGTRAGLDGNVLHLGGKPARAGTGTLINTNPDPLVPAEWAGRVAIESDTTLGGVGQTSLGGKLGGDIVLSGPVSGSADVDVVTRRELVLKGDNSSFTGNWNLKDGYLRLQGANPVGAGTLVFEGSYADYYYTYGAAYRYGSTNDTDLSAVSYDVSDANLQIDVGEGLEYHPSFGFSGFNVGKAHVGELYKTGLGTLRLSKSNGYDGAATNPDHNYWLTIETGTVVFDYTENGDAKLIGAVNNGSDGSYRLGESACLNVLGMPGNDTISQYVVGPYRKLIGYGALATAVFSDDVPGTKPNLYNLQTTTFGDGGADKVQGIMNIVANAGKWLFKSGSPRCDSQAEHDANYPSIRHPGEIWNATTFTYQTANVYKGVNKYKGGSFYGTTLSPVPDSWYAPDFATVSSNATSTANSLVDVTPELCADGVHADVACAALRFNTPNGGTPLVLNLDGAANLGAGVILITPNMGNTPVVIRGGHIVRMPADQVYANMTMRILNFNTNATLTIESNLGCDIAGMSGSLGVYGPGKTIFTGKFLASGAVAVNGGVLACGDGQNLLAACRANGTVSGKSWAKFRELYLYGGGLLEFSEDANGIVAVPGETEGGHAVYNGWRPRIGAAGGGFAVAEGRTLTLNEVDGWEQTIYTSPNGGRFIKSGKGKVSYAGTMSQSVQKRTDTGLGIDATGRRAVASYELREGSIERPGTPANNQLKPDYIFNPSFATVLTAGDGTMMIGREFATSRLADCNIWSGDSGNAVRIVIPDGVTTTLDRHSTSADKPGDVILNTRNTMASGVRGGGIWAGLGTLIVTNSASSTVGADYGGFCNRLFKGTVKDCCGVGSPDKAGNNRNTGRGANFKNAAFEIASGTGWYVGYAVDGGAPLRLGGLDGTGTFLSGWQWSAYWVSPRIGGDDGKTHDFNGLLQINRNGGGIGEFVKVGSNTQRISGSANEVQTSARVADGTLVLGHPRALDSVTYSSVDNNIYVGGAETADGMAPQFLVDCGDVTLPNKVKVLGCLGTNVVPGIGAKSGNVTFCDLTISNACALVAEAGATAVFSKISQLGAGYPITLRGSGTVEVSGDLAVKGVFGVTWDGSFAVSGKLTVAEGTKLDVEVPEKLMDGQVYTLVSAGSIDGSFDVSGIVLPERWTIRQNGRSVVVKQQSGLILIVQ